MRRIFESQGLKVQVACYYYRYGTVILPRELRTGRWMELDKTDIDNLAKSSGLKPRQVLGLFGMAKRRTEKMAEKPCGGAVVAVIYVNSVVMNSQINNSAPDANSSNSGRKTVQLNKGFKVLIAQRITLKTLQI